eukprot:jgi/Botrbrau1/18914/Bobra.177_2s0069.2
MTMASLDGQQRQPADAPFSKNVAIIGAGAAGLVAGKVLREEGHRVVLLEQGLGVGGVWMYTDEVDEDPLGRSGAKVHSSMYRDLRTNLPRDLMSYPDLPFRSDWMRGRSRDPRRLPGHAEVQAYLEAYCDVFGLLPFVRCNTTVRRVIPVPAVTPPHLGTSLANVAGSDSVPGALGTWEAGGTGTGHPELRWRVASSVAGGPEVEEEYDAVVVCNGHYADPRVPRFPGQGEWGGRQMHSHNYRSPDPFRGTKVVVVGVSASGEDLSREIGDVADKVFLCGRAPDWPCDADPYGSRSNIYRRPNIASLDPERGITFANGWREADVDWVIYATGYYYSFPFLEESGLVRVQDNTIQDLYGQVFLAHVGPSLSFIGIPWRIVPLPQFHLQAAWIARCLSRRARLPSQEAMREALAEDQRELAQQGMGPSQTHYQGDAQWRYNDWVAEQAGRDVPPLPAWREAMYNSVGAWKRAHPADYRDTWRDPPSEAEAEAEVALFQKLSNGGRNSQEATIAPVP